ncbi:MAG: XdhC family protein, partial [Ktedonobacteraceae bacterium]
RYVGMIGSPGKIKNIFRDLLKEGMSRERVAQVHSPIGLDLGAETPDEIALSIAAEIVMLRKQGTGSSLKTVHNFIDEVTIPAESRT